MSPDVKWMYIDMMDNNVHIVSSRSVITKTGVLELIIDRYRLNEGYTLRPSLGRVLSDEVWCIYYSALSHPIEDLLQGTDNAVNKFTVYAVEEAMYCLESKQ